MNSITRHIIIWALALSALVSCDKTQQPASLDKWIENGHISITARNGESRDKTILKADGSILWSPCDSISVFFGSYNLGKFTAMNTTPANLTVFKSESTFATGSIGETGGSFFWSVNPFSNENYSDGNSVTLRVPSVQTAVDGTFAPGSFPSIAKSDNLEFEFFNVCGGIRFKVLNHGIKKVVFKGNNNEVIAGKVQVDLSSGGRPSVVKILEPGTSVTLQSDKGLTPGTWYCISLLPATLSKGFTLEMSTKSQTVKFVSEKNTAIKRTTFGVLSNIDQGFTLEQDWTQCEFIRKSLLLTVPNCSFPSFFINDENELITTARSQTSGNIEVMQVFANGPSPTTGVQSLISNMNITTVPFEITDFREKVSGSVTPYSTYLSTPQLYGTKSGIAIKSYYNGNELNIEASLYFKQAGEYKLLVALVQDDSYYTISTYSGTQTTTIKSDGITRYILTDILGDNLSVVTDETILYRSFKKSISDASVKQNLRALVIILRPYGDQTPVTNGNFGSYFVDNAFSVLAGQEVKLPMTKYINSEIADFEYGGIISL